MNTQGTTQRVHTACPHDCPSTCALEVEVLDKHTIGRVYGADNPYTAGVVCAKVARYAQRVHHPDRLSHPLIRKNGKAGARGEFERLDWDSALDLIADRFQNIIADYGAEAIWPYHFAGTMGLVQRDGLDRLRHCLGTSLQHSTFCTTLADAGWKAGTGSKRGSNPLTIQSSELVVVWGTNAVNTQVNLMHHISVARKKGAKLVVVDPYLNGTAKQADLHLMLRPGTDGALACAVIHVLLEEGLADHDYLQQYTDFDESVEIHLAEKTPAWASEITGLPVEQIVGFARLYGSVKRSFLRTGYGFSRSRNGAVNMHAVSCLPAVTGAWRYEGGGALYANADIYGIDKTLISGLDKKPSGKRVLDQSRIGDVLLGNPDDLAGGPPIMALFTQNTNPAVVAPETVKVLQGLARDDLFCVVHEQFMTDTAALADVVLPATMFLEHDDVYQGGGHVYLQVTKKVIEPFAECRSNHELLSGLAKRLGVQHPGFEMTEWQMIEKTLSDTGLPTATEIHEKRWHSCAPDFERCNFLDGFPTDDGRFHFKADWQAIGSEYQRLPVLPDHCDVIDAASADYPYRLVAAPARHYLNTSFTEMPGSVTREKKPTLKVLPKDLQSLGLRDGQRVRISSRCGSIVVEAEAFDGLLSGVVVLESIWPNDAFEEGVGVNALISAEPGLPNGGAVFHDTAIRIEAA